MTSHASKTSVYLLKYSFIIYEMQLTTSTRLMLTHPRIGRWHEDDDHHHLTKINHYTVAPRLRLRPSLNALVAMLVAMRLERLRPSPNLFFFTSPHSPRPRTPRTANRIRPCFDSKHKSRNCMQCAKIRDSDLNKRNIFFFRIPPSINML